MDFGVDFEKSKCRFGISILEILCAPILRQSGQVWIFVPEFAHKLTLGLEFEKCKCGFGISILEILCAPISRQKRQLWTFGLKLALKWI